MKVRWDIKHSEWNIVEASGGSSNITQASENKYDRVYRVHCIPGYNSSEWLVLHIEILLRFVLAINVFWKFMQNLCF